MISENLLSYNSSFVDGPSGWTTYTSGTPTLHTSDSFIGYGCLKVTKTSGSSDSGVYTTVAYQPAVTVSGVYSASAYIKIPTGQESGTFTLAIQYYNSGSLVSTVTGTATAVDSTLGWTRITASNNTAPSSGVTNIAVLVYQSAGSKTIGNYYLVDAVKLENSAIVTQYIEARDQGQENKKVNTALSPVPIPHITGMQLRADIMLNDIVFNTIDENDVVWVCSDIEGWWELPDSEVPDLTRGLDDGSYDVRGRYSARNLTFTGSILAPSADAAATARNKFIKSIDLIHSGGWLLVDEVPTKAAYVRISGKPQITSMNARGRIDFSVGLRAANPIKYAWNWEDSEGYETATVSNGSSAVLNNTGNTNVPISFTITGGTSANLTAPITINNTSTSPTQAITVVKNLRSAAYSTNVTRSQRDANAVTLTTVEHSFYAGDIVTISNISIVIGITASERTGTTVTLTTAGHSFKVGDVVTIANVTTAGRTSLNESSRTITGVTSTQITYTSATSGALVNGVTNGDITLVGADSRSSFNTTSATITNTTTNTITYNIGTSGTLSDAVTSGVIDLDNADTLVVDTYSKSVLFNGSATYARSYVDALVDWIVLQPGNNTITFTDSGGTTDMTVKYRPGWIG